MNMINRLRDKVVHAVGYVQRRSTMGVGGTPHSVTKVEFKLAVDVTEEEGKVLVTARPLGVSTFGATQDEAFARLVDAVDSLLESLCEHNELISSFNEKGVEYELQRVVADPTTCADFSVNLDEPVGRGRAFTPLVPA